MSSEAQRKRKSSHSPAPGRKRAKQPETNPPLKEIIDDEIFGQLSIDRSLRFEDQDWLEFRSPIRDRFVWVYWEDSGKQIAYKLRHRDKHVLVINSLPKPEGPSNFNKEVKFMSEVEGLYAIEQDNILGPVTVLSWDEIHQTRDHVGDEYFYRKYPLPQHQICGAESCPDNALTSNAAYVLCRYRLCRQAYHAACLPQGPSAFRRGYVKSLDNKPLECSECEVLFASPVERSVADNVFTVCLDIGTARPKAVATTSDGKRTQLLDSLRMPKPMVFINTEDEIFFRPRTNFVGTTIQPIKKLICGQETAPTTWRASKILQKYFAEIISRLVEQITEPHSMRSILLAVAVPAGLPYYQQCVVLNAALESWNESETGTEVVPVMLNEAKMAYLGGRQDAHPSSQPWLALACDVGGFSMDIALLYVKPTTGSIDVLAKRSDSLYIGDGWLVSDIVDDIMFGATDDKPVPMDSESLVRFFVEQYFTALYLGEEPKSEYISSGDRKPRIQFGHVIERYRKKQIEDVRACIRKLLRRVEGVAELVVTGGGAQDWGLVDAINEASGSALAPGVRAHVAPRPSPEKSTVLDGIQKHMMAQSCRTNKFTVVIDSFNNCDKDELIILQRCGEATENPVIPAARSLQTIFYEIEAQDERHSSHRLLVSVKDIPLSVNERSYQVANVSPNSSDLHLLDTIKVDIRDPFEEPKMLHLEVVEIHLHEGHGTATVSALLLRPRTADDADWISWGIRESMSVEEIGRMASRTNSRFLEVSRMAKKIFPLDFESVRLDAEGVNLFNDASDLERVGPGDFGGVVGSVFDDDSDPERVGPGKLGGVGGHVFDDESDLEGMVFSKFGGVGSSVFDDESDLEGMVFSKFSGVGAHFLDDTSDFQSKVTDEVDKTTAREESPLVSMPALLT